LKNLTIIYYVQTVLSQQIPTQCAMHVRISVQPSEANIARFDVESVDDRITIALIAVE
jgi:hypothetical protein